MKFPILGNEVPNMSAQQASTFMRELVLMEEITSGTKQRAIEVLAREYGLTPSQITHLYKRRAKSCDVSLFQRIQLAYLDKCARMAMRLQHNIETQGAVGSDAFDEDLLARASQLVAEANARKAAVSGRKKAAA